MKEKTKTFWTIAAIAYPMVAAVMFGVLWTITIIIGAPVFATPLFQFDTGATPLFLGIALSFILSAPLSALFAWIMLKRPEKNAMTDSRTGQLPTEDRV